MTPLTQQKEALQVFHYLTKTLDKIRNNPQIDVQDDLNTWGNFFDPAVKDFLEHDVQPRLLQLQQHQDNPRMNAVIDYVLLSMRMIVEENDEEHDAITDELDVIWYDGMESAGVEIHNATLGPLLSDMSSLVYTDRKKRITLS